LSWAGCCGHRQGCCRLFEPGKVLVGLIYDLVKDKPVFAKARSVIHGLPYLMQKALKVMLFPSHYFMIAKNDINAYLGHEAGGSHVIFVAGFPKSGTTWVENFISRIPGYSPRVLAGSQEVIRLHRLPACAFDRVSRCAYSSYKTHITPSRENIDVLVKKGIDKVLVMYRDPRDIIVSNYYHVLQSNPWRTDDPWYADYTVMSKEDALSHSLDLMVGLYDSWVTGWRRVAQEHPAIDCLMVQYESLRENPEKVFSDILAFFGVEMTHSTFQDLLQSVDGRFAKFQDFGEPGKRSTRRKGASGEWKHELNDEQKQRINERLGPLLVELGYESGPGMARHGAANRFDSIGGTAYRFLSPEAEDLPRLIFITAAPCGRIFGRTLAPEWFQDNGFQVEFWDISPLYYDEQSLAAYSSGASGYRFKGPGYRLFQSRENVKKALDGLGRNDVFWHLTRTSFTLCDDFWLLHLFKQHRLRYVVMEFENQIFTGSGEKGRRTFGDLFMSAIHRRAMLAKILSNRFKSWVMKHTTWYQWPGLYIGVGGVAERRYREVFRANTKFVSVPSTLINWSPPELADSSSYHVFVDESIASAPDAKLENRIICNDIDQYYKNMNRVFSVIEAHTGVPVIIAASGKFEYAEDVFEGRRVVYGKTLKLIHQSSMVIGHASSGLYQAIVSRKPVLLVNDSTFTGTKQRDVKKMASFFGVMPVPSADLQQDHVEEALAMDTSCFSTIEEDYFRSRGVGGDWHEIVAEALRSAFGKDSEVPTD